MKAVRPPSTFMASQSLGASFNSPTLDLTQEDIGAIQLNFSGSSPVGNLTLQGSLDQTNWGNLYFSVNGNGTAVNTLAIGSATSPIIIELSSTMVPYLRISYSFTSGSGTMTGIVTAKRLGD